MHDRIDSSAFRRLLQSLENSDVRIRLRGMGESWITLSKLLLLSDNAMILQSEDERRIILNIRNIVEFQLEQKFRDYDADTIYEVFPDI